MDLEKITAALNTAHNTQEAGFHATPVLVGLRKFLSEFFFFANGQNEFGDYIFDFNTDFRTVFRIEISLFLTELWSCSRKITVGDWR